jgi:hypothetical protein
VQLSQMDPLLAGHITAYGEQSQPSHSRNLNKAVSTSFLHFHQQNLCMRSAFFGCDKCLQAQYLILSGLYRTKMRGPWLTADWNSGKRCATWRQAKVRQRKTVFDGWRPCRVGTVQRTTADYDWNRNPACKQ